ncbi:MAG: rhodanese-like domain-containing protein [Gemmataceae bacterium]
MFITTLLLFALANETRYAKPTMLIEPADLVKVVADGKAIILDVRPRKEYEAGHVPGARWVDVEVWSKAVNAGEGGEKWTHRVGALGIDGSIPVVVVDGARPLAAARVWWILRHWGLEDVRLLNGGWKGWREKGGPEVTEVPVVVPTRPKLKKVPERLATREQVSGVVKMIRAQTRVVGTTPGWVLIDTRSKEEHCGEKKTAKRNGAIPEARHLEWSDTIDPITGRFKTAPELEMLMANAGFSARNPAVTYCQSGGRAAVMAFVMELMSGQPAMNYYRSWAEWGNDPDTPVVTPKKK